MYSHSRLARLVAVMLIGGLCVRVTGVARSARAQTEDAAPGDAQTVQVTYRVYAGDKAPTKAREQAIRRAQAEAVRRVVGTQVQAERVSASVRSGEERVDRFAQIVRTGASGRVVESEVLKGETVEVGGNLFYRVELEATVRPERGTSDPAFEATVSLNQEDRVYVDRGAPEESDELVASLRVTKEAYLTVFNVTPDTIRVVWPNSRLPDTHVPADTTVEFPPPEERRMGLRWRVQVPDGEAATTERIVVVATREEIPFRPVPRYDVENGRLKTAGATVEALNRWLVEIPLDQRTVATATYHVKDATGRVDGR